MAKLPRLENIKYVRAKGRVYAYFNTGQKARGRPVYARLPDPSSPHFLASYQALKAGRTKRQSAVFTISALIDDYQRGAEFKGRSTATQNSYNIHLAKVDALLGKFSVDALEERHVRLMLDNEPWGPATKNLVVAVIGSAYRWGRRHGKTTADPVRGIGREKTGRHEPWPETVLEAALAADDDLVRLAVHLLYFTGQRIGDVTRMRWTDVRGGKVRIVQQKTGKPVSFPIAAELQAELGRAPRRGLTILTNDRGQPVKDAWLRGVLQDFTLELGAKTVPHGLRKNAVIALLEAGCTVAEVAAITGQSYAIVEHYAARINTDRLGSAAILKLDARRRNES